MPLPKPNPAEFKPGQTGNPKGRPKGTKNLSSLLKDMLNEKVDVLIDGKKVQKEFQETIIRKLILKAAAGDIKAIAEIFDRVEGKAKQAISHESEGIRATIS